MSQALPDGHVPVEDASYEELLRDLFGDPRRGRDWERAEEARDELIRRRNVLIQDLQEWPIHDGAVLPKWAYEVLDGHTGGVPR